MPLSPPAPERSPWTAPASPAPRAPAPVYTIAALAEHSMETIVRRDVGRVF
ncbi:hypothetical protein ACFVW1_03495 [Streptomyces olivochromogenes]|uniref:hypothetical protein n=1 Tax=Streptomyces olivochromogenes TaxID=1963 RepID=UPI0036DD87A9